MKLTHHFVRILWIMAGLASLATGIIGIVLPVLPTTPFLLLAAFCFARGSERMSNWLINHPRFGPPIADWQKYGAISSSAKKWALVVIAATPIVTWFAGAPLWAIGVQVVMLAGVTTFIVTRPLPPNERL